jgi:tight adherence protein C
LGAAVGFLLTHFLRHATFLQNAMVILVGAAIGFYIPTIIVALRGRRRRERLNRVLPDMVDLLVICMEAGMALSSAFQKVSEEIDVASGDMHDELQLVLLEMETGLSRADALQNLSRRTGVEDIQSLSGMLIQAEKFGTSIARSLRVFADSMRTHRTQRAEEAAAKTPVKLTFPLVFCLFPALFVVILLPACIRLYTNLLGPTGPFGR